MIASTDSALDQVSFPSSMAVDSMGRLYVEDTGNRRIQRYTLSPDRYGDLDIDGEATVSDAILCLKIIAGLTPSTSDPLKWGDVSPQ